MNLFFNRKPVPCVNDTLELYSAHEFASPTRSTIPLLALLKEHQKLTEIFAQIGLSIDSELHLEYKVSPLKGKGNASHTDVMIVSDTTACALEAKWTEPRYSNCTEWLNKGKIRSNRVEVLTGWVNLINQNSKNNKDYTVFGDIPYQMIHRAASACTLNRKPVLAYLQFAPLPNNTPPTGCVVNDLTVLWNLLGKPADFPFYSIEVTLTPNHSYTKIKYLKKGSLSTANDVMSSFKNGELFSFRDIKVTKIG